MKKFSEFYYELLKESPHNISDDDEYFSEILKGNDLYKEIKNSPDSYKKVFVMNTTPPIELWEQQDGDDRMCYFLPTNGNDFIYGYVYYEVTADGGCITTSVYNDKKYLGLAFKVYNEYLLTKFNYVMSDGNHTPKGKNFWRNLLTFNKDKHRMIWDMSNNSKAIDIEEPKDMDEFYNDSMEYEKYRVRIQNR